MSIARPVRLRSWRLRSWRLHVAACAVSTCLVAQAPVAGAAGGAADAAPQDPGRLQFVHDFGGSAGRDEPGYRIVFDRMGAGVRSVRLLDHRESTESDEPYALVREERVDPNDPSRGAFAWLLLEERQRGELFPGLAGGLGAGTEWTVVRATPEEVRFSIDGGRGLRLEKVFRHERGRRDLIVELALIAAADHAGPTGREHELELGGVALVSPRAQYVLGGNPALAVGVDSVVDGDPLVVFQAADGKPDAERAMLASRRAGPIAFAGTTNRFFAAFLYTRDEESSLQWRRASMSEVPEREQNDTPAFSLPVAHYGIYVRVPAPGAEHRLGYRLYLGPKSFRAFDENPEYGAFDLVVRRDLDPPCCGPIPCAVPGAQTMAIFLLWLLGVLHDLVGSWGLGIVCMTILVRSALVPLNFRMQKAMRAYGAKMAKLKPKIDEIQRKYANNRKELQQQMMLMQREHKMFPPLGGCLPMFVTIPVFIGLFSALRTSYDLRHQPFMLWIHDLSAPDALFATGWSLLPHFNVLPIVMVALWWWLQSGTPLPSDPQQRQVMKIMRFMPIVFGVMLYTYASGLMIYMITSSIYALIEQRVTRRILGPVSPEAAGLGTVPTL